MQGFYGLLKLGLSSIPSIFYGEDFYLGTCCVCVDARSEDVHTQISNWMIYSSMRVMLG